MGPSRRSVLGSVATGLSVGLAGCGFLGGDRAVWEYEKSVDALELVDGQLHAYETAKIRGNSGFFRVLDPANGEVTHDAGALGILWNVTSDGHRSYFSGENRVSARAPDGSRAWFFPFETADADLSFHGQVADLAAADGTVMATRAESMLTTVDADGEELRTTETDRWEGVGDLVANVLVAGDDRGFVTVHIEDGVIYGDDTQGRQQWTVETPWTSDEPRNAVLTSEDAIAVACEEALHVHQRSGEHRWSIEVADLDDGVVTIGTDQVYVLESDGRLTAYDLAEGSEQWVFEPDELGATGLVTADDAVYCSMQMSVFALDSAGEQRWQHEGISGALAVDDQRVYAADDGLVALERE